jgi:hypothetical protein
MTTFLLSLLPVCLGIWCVHILFQENHLLEKAGDWITEKLGKYWSKPLINCPICMSSLYGLIGFFAIDFFFGVHHDIKLLIPFIFCLCGLNTILSKLTSHDRILKEIDSEAFRQLYDLTETKKAA